MNYIEWNEALAKRYFCGVKAALDHVQFYIMRLFLDGNDRLGCLHISLLVHHGLLDSDVAEIEIPAADDPECEELLSVAKITEKISLLHHKIARLRKPR